MTPPVVYTVEVCDEWWKRKGELGSPDSLTMTDRLCDVGSGSLDCPATAENRALVQPGCTLHVVRPDNTVRQSGIVTTYGIDEPSNTLKVDWETPLRYMDRDDAWPNPDADTETGQGPNEYDRRSGPASAVILGYAVANVGPGSDWRQARGVVFDDSPLAGESVPTVEARWSDLLDLLRNIAIPAGVAFDITTVDRTHHFSVRAVRDLSRSVVFSSAEGNLLGGDWSVTAPQATRVLALGKGDGVDRATVMVTSAESLAQEARWGPSVYVHDSGSADPDALQAEALRQLSEKGETWQATYTIDPEGAFRFGTDYLLGDFVTVEGLGMPAPLVAPVREAQETWASGGRSFTLTVGDYASTAVNGTAYRAREVLRVVDALKRNR